MVFTFTITLGRPLISRLVISYIQLLFYGATINSAAIIAARVSELVYPAGHNLGGSTQTTQGYLKRYRHGGHGSSCLPLPRPGGVSRRGRTIGACVCLPAFVELEDPTTKGTATSTRMYPSDVRYHPSLMLDMHSTLLFS